MVLWKSVDGSSDGLQSGHLANRLYEYASLLASQGCLATAVNYLAPVTSDDVCCVLTSLLTPTEHLNHSSCVGLISLFLPKMPVIFALSVLPCFVLCYGRPME